MPPGYAGCLTTEHLWLRGPGRSGSELAAYGLPQCSPESALSPSEILPQCPVGQYRSSLLSVLSLPPPLSPESSLSPGEPRFKPSRKKRFPATGSPEHGGVSLLSLSPGHSQGRDGPSPGPLSPGCFLSLVAFFRLLPPGPRSLGCRAAPSQSPCSVPAACWYRVTSGSSVSPVSCLLTTSPSAQSSRPRQMPAIAAPQPRT
eukprot:767017-Hanusia_phi.AAC.3